MKVICIKGDDLKEVDGRNSPSDPKLVEGRTYTVLSIEIYKGNRFYILEELPQDCCFHEKRFIPLSSIDETELVNEKEQVCI